ncbi:dCTP deaminase/dUTPase family protein [Lacticaseibacillus saniviri]|uniref:dUTP diphosphatase n=1 Tax=Lacticaseibacillus saniviri JCM 17471 = DSM 24301 TaxID=1293598 RepID=A0A0R2MWP8_9LACO|nr:dUTP diphosphatase [Lacticaseibacillus saniviri]KRO18056.1 dUTP diphosphatase [Lacticaseibacillus saniviri JCM 17471 = DSM 24301]MCG4282312.1 dUTP diphosphatase [Lacticaseibacillus saniviri]
MAIRGFEVVSTYKEQDITLPTRQTKQAAGYDFYAREDFVLKSVWRYNFIRLFRLIKNEHPLTESDFKRASKTLKPQLVPTGVKAYMQPDEMLVLANRSSNPLKRGLILPNGIGIVDADYYNNDDNEGEIFFQLVNLSPKDMIIRKGERIGQGIFMPFLKADNDSALDQVRKSGFGSTGK